MYGAILGDMIGSPYEFDRGEKIKAFPLFIEKSRFTDDTVMTVAVADALLYAGKDAEEKKICTAVVSSMQHWGRKYPNAGYGGRFREWLKEKLPKPYGSFGNGSAMRVSAAGWLYDSIERTRDIARWTAEVTHNHAEGIKGAESVASAIYLARMGESKVTIKKYIEEEFGYNLSRTLKEIRPSYHMDVTCQGSVPEAMIAFLESTDFEDAVRNAVSIGGDTDTTACIAGSIAEAYYGLTPTLEKECFERIPEKMKSVLHHFDCMRGKAIQGEPIIEAALRRYLKDNSTENMAAVLDAIYIRMKDDGYFLLPPSEAQQFDECVECGDYDSVISIEAYTSDCEFFMGLDEDDDNDDYITEVKIYDLLSFIAKVTDAEAGIDINYVKNFYLSRDMARSILAKGEEKAAHQRGLYLSIPDKISISPKDLSPEFISGVRFCFMCAYNAYTNYCELYHRNGKIYHYDISGDHKKVEKICQAFPALKKFHESGGQNDKLEEWEWNYYEQGGWIFAHAEVQKAYKMRTGYTDYLIWSPDDAYMTIQDLLEEENMDKGKKYRELVERSQVEYRNHPEAHKNTRIVLQAAPEGLCSEINLYTYWQGFGYGQVIPKIKYLLVAQDWGNPNAMNKGFEERIKAMNQGEKDVNYLDKKSIDFQTDANLIELFKVLGYDSIANTRYADLFFTNFCLGYRAGRESGGMTKKLMMKDSGFFKKLCDILEPENILCLGQLTFQCVYETLTGEKISSLKGFKDGYNTFIEKHEAIAAECGSVSANIYPLAHCGSMGTMNRNKICKDDPCVKKDALFLQKADWERIKTRKQ